jgi:integrase
MSTAKKRAGRLERKPTPLTDRELQGLKATGHRYELMDRGTGATKGLGVRVGEGGQVTFFLQKRFPGTPIKAEARYPHPTRRVLGTYPAMSLAEARKKAQAWDELIKQGIDPGQDEKRKRQEDQRRRSNTFAALLEDFIVQKLGKREVDGRTVYAERRGAEVERDIRREFLPVWGDWPISEVTARDVRDVVVAIKNRGAPYQAHNVLGHAKRIFGWAVDQHVYGLEVSPCDRLKPRAIVGEKKARQRVLSDDEIRAFWRAASRMPYPYGPAARMLLLTGQRHREVAEARRSEFHPELLSLIRKHDAEPVSWQNVSADWKLWSVGAERFKSDAPHMVPLPNDVCSLIASLPQFRGPYLFSTTAGQKPTVISDKEKNRLDARMLRTLKAMARLRGDDPKAVEMKPWVIHDLRRTLRTQLSALRVQDHVAEMVIGHGRKGLQRVYDQHRYLNEMREALELWAARLRSVVEPATAPPNVVHIAEKWVEMH